MDEIKRLQIRECVEVGDWGIIGDSITRNDLMDYLLYYTNPEITERGLAIKKLPKVDCPLCGSPTKPQALALTHRAVKFLLCAVWLSQEDIKKGDKGSNGYVHYEVIRDLCQGKFINDKGKRLGKGISFTSYGTLTRAPWNFLSPRQSTNEKAKRDGMLKPTLECMRFLKGEIAVPERVEILDAKVVRYSRKLVYAAKAKDINWQQCLNIYKTF